MFVIWQFFCQKILPIKEYNLTISPSLFAPYYPHLDHCEPFQMLSARRCRQFHESLGVGEENGDYVNTT